MIAQNEMNVQERISTLKIPDSRYEKKNTQIEHIIAHF